MHTTLLPSILQTKIIAQLSINIAASLSAASCFRGCRKTTALNNMAWKYQLNMRIYPHKQGHIDSAILSIFCLVLLSLVTFVDILFKRSQLTNCKTLTLDRGNNCLYCCLNSLCLVFVLTSSRAKVHRYTIGKI
jgi:hypothetical protein